MTQRHDPTNPVSVDAAIDDQLRRAFDDAAARFAPEPTDPETLADTILARVDAVSEIGPHTGRGGRWSAGIIGGLVVVPLVVGALLGTALGVATGDDGAASTAQSPTQSPASVETTPLWRCPNGGRVGTLTDGDRVVMTGRTADRLWLEIRMPSDLDARVWVVAAAVDADAATDDLPVTECAVPTATQPAATTATDPNQAPTTTPPSQDTAVAPSTTTAVTPARPTTTLGRTSTTVSGGTASTTSPSAVTTTVPADTTGPTLTNVGVNPTPIWTAEQPGVPCTPPKPHIASFVVTASDPSGVASVRLDWVVNGRTGTVAMSRGGSSWQANIGPFPGDTLPTSGSGMNQNVSVTVVATDGVGRTSTTTTAVALRSSAECFG